VAAAGTGHVGAHRRWHQCSPCREKEREKKENGGGGDIPPLAAVDEWRWERRRRQSLSDRGPRSIGGPTTPSAGRTHKKKSAEHKEQSESRRRARELKSQHRSLLPFHAKSVEIDAACVGLMMVGGRTTLPAASGATRPPLGQRQQRAGLR